jgi:hypothetical protein
MYVIQTKVYSAFDIKRHNTININDHHFETPLRLVLIKGTVAPWVTFDCIAHTQ